jgi:hypothetical protein
MRASAVDVQPGTVVLSTFNTNQETLKIATSADGVNFQMLTKSGSESLYAAPSGGLRDPSLARIGDSYFVAYTAGNFGDADHFAVIRSDDLLTWTPVANVDASNLNPTHTWAPELFVDEDGTVMAFVAVETGNYFLLHWSRATNASLTAWTPLAPVGGAFIGRVCIDPHVVKKGGTYFLSYRHYDSSGTGDYIEIATSSSPTTGYTLNKTGNFAGWGGGGKEGPCLQHRGGARWRMYLSDSTRPNSPIVFSDSSDDMATWTGLTDIVSNTVTPPLVHGTLVVVPEKIADFQIARAAPGPDVRVSFSAAAGVSYRVQYRDAMSADPWLTLQNVGPHATATAAEVIDPGALGMSRRFYRVISVR